MIGFQCAEDDVETFEQNGFVSVEDVVAHDELLILRQTCTQLIENETGKDAGDQFDLAGSSRDLSKAKLPQIMTPSKYAPQLQDLKYRHDAQAIAQQLLGDAVKLMNEHFIFKPAHHGGETPWHQDQAYHDPSRRFNSANVWLALSDATVDNGCMHYVPGSHRLDVLPHHNIGHDPAAAGLEVDRPEKYSKHAVACPVRAGGVVVHRSYMLHYAGPNLTDKPRPAYVLVFGCEPQLRETPLEFPWLTAHHDGSRPE